MGGIVRQGIAGQARRGDTGHPSSHPASAAMSQTIDDHDAITRLVQLYIDGAGWRCGQAACRLPCRRAHVRPYRPGRACDSDRRLLRHGGRRQGVARRAEVPGTIVSIHVTGDAGVAVLAEQDYLGCDFIDYFSVARIGGEWKIVNKTYAHTGGQLPGA